MNGTTNATPSIPELAHAAAETAYFREMKTGGERVIPAGFSEVAHDGALGEQMARADCIHLRHESGAEFVAFRGTANGKDWKDNVKQVAGSAIAYAAKTITGKSPKSIRSEKYDAAAKIGDAFRNQNVIFTGHSLGGGLAKLAGEVASTPEPGSLDKPTSKNVISFNGAPVTPQTYMLHGCAPKDHLRTTTHFINQHDILNRVLKGGKAHFASGDLIADRESGNTTLVHVKGGGEKMSVPGHGLKAFDAAPVPGQKPVFTAPSFDSKGRPMNLAEFDAITKTPINDPSARRQLEVSGHRQVRANEKTLSASRADGGSRGR